MFCAIQSNPVRAQSKQPNIETIRINALAGDPWAQLNLGAAYDHGLSGVASNPVEAVRWYRLAAQQGLSKAQFNLAHCLASGYGVAQDYVEARVWMRRAAEQGMADAQFLLGVMFLDGLGGEPDKQQAVDWLRKSAENGNLDAVGLLKKIR